MTALAAAATTRRTRRSPRRALAWHPEWWVYAVAALAWVDLALMSLASTRGRSPRRDGDAGGDGRLPVVVVRDAWSDWVLMVVAMMLPVVAPQVRTVALRSLWTRRQRSAGAFLAGYVAVWVAAGAVLLAPLVALDVYPLGPAWLVGILLVAAGWQVSPPRRRLLRRCASLRLGAADGRAADLDCARAGLRSGVRCLATCGPLMLAMLAGHSLLADGGPARGAAQRALARPGPGPAGGSAARGVDGRRAGRGRRTGGGALSLGACSSYCPGRSQSANAFGPATYGARLGQCRASTVPIVVSSIQASPSGV